MAEARTIHVSVAINLHTAEVHLHNVHACLSQDIKRCLVGGVHLDRMI